MSGPQTIRDVVIKMAIEYTSNPMAVFNFADAKRGFDDFEAHAKSSVDRVRSYAENSRLAIGSIEQSRLGVSDNGSAHGNGDSLAALRQSFGQEIASLRERVADLRAEQERLAMVKTPVSAHDTQMRLRDLQGQSYVMGSQDRDNFIKRRSAQEWQEYNAAQKESTSLTRENAESVLTLIRGMSLLGASLGQNTEGWLKLAATAQGSMDLISSAQGTMGTLAKAASRLPPHVGVMAAGVALAASPFLIEKYDQQLHDQDYAELTRNQRDRKRYEGNVTVQTRGIAGHAWDWFDKNVGRPFREGWADSADVDDERASEAALMSQKKMGEMREQERIDTQSELDARHGRYSRKIGELKMSREFGFSTLDDYRRDYDIYSGKRREGFEEMKKAPQVPGGVRGLQIGAVESQFNEDDAKQRLDIERQMISELEREKHAYASILEQAQQTLGVEKERLQAERERLGSASSQDLVRLNAIGQKLARGGDLNEEEARLASQHGLKGADNQVGKFFEKRFAQRISAEAQRGFGLNEGVDKAEGNLQDARRNYDNAVPEIDGQMQQSRETAQKLIEELPKLIEATQTANKAVLDGIKKLTEEQRKFETEVKTGSIKAFQ